jgi:hypothetical protein
MTLESIGVALFLAASLLLMFVLMTGTIAQYCGRRPRLWQLFRNMPQETPFTRWRPGRLFGLAVLAVGAMLAEAIALLMAVASSRLSDRLIMLGELVAAVLWLVYLARLEPVTPPSDGSGPPG